jgi:hypothetical protein
MIQQQPQNQALWLAIKMGENDRGVLIGKTGGGKTTLAKFLVEDENKPYSVSWNPKGSEKVLEWDQKHVSSLTEMYNEESKPENTRLVYTPSALMARNMENQYEFFYWIYERRNTRLYIDEATEIQYNGLKPPDYLTACLNRGRERGVSTLTATQRPAGVPMNILSESEHYYVFKLNLHQDRQRVEQICGITIEQQIDLKDFEFYYFNVSRGLLPRKLRLNLNGVE